MENMAGEHEIQCLIIYVRVQHLPETLSNLAMKAKDCILGLDFD